MTDNPTAAMTPELLAADIMAAMRRARFPKEYADEAHDEFEALVLTPMLRAALQSAQPSAPLAGNKEALEWLDRRIADLWDIRTALHASFRQRGVHP
jgi:hypothetical protein